MRYSSGLLFGVAAVLLLRAVVDLAFVNTDLSVYKDAYTGTTGSAFGSLVYATLSLVGGAAVSIMAILNLHGSDRSRVTTFVLGGLFLSCGGWGDLPDVFQGPAGRVGGDGFARVAPAGYGLVVGVLDLSLVLALLVSLVLLALPPSTRFFQGRRPVGYVTVPVYHPTGPQPPVHPGPPPPFPPSSSPPHTTSIPMADPWAERG
ncbi:hypothetical protein Asp14428_09120 [Actinoplanes sp. NBRC 14428]|uniref:Uncharacterized protein n=2 Tax=Pseudosporangium ferrugineum TaxID=439699 RepID=A0A2T0SFX0_9ACTN|nr:hypothetical protein CLV70_102521 [Pseudosporangium ferrugineum]BCJ49437.1 hypothetical protein Asp14428_09120 [Actinoplanes sp. NBRC 14428]